MSFKSGDKVKIIKNSNHHRFEIGTVVTLKERYIYSGYSQEWLETRYKGAPYIIAEEDFVIATTPGVDCVF